MTREPNKRPRRNPLTSEEVSHIIAYKRKKELIALMKLKRSPYYKIHNIFNVACIFIYLEILFCYFGPCHYQEHHAVSTYVHYGQGPMEQGKLYISDLDVKDSEGKRYKFVIEKSRPVPPQSIAFIIGKDFLLQKDLKGVLADSSRVYRLFSASPILLLCALVSFVSFFAFMMNLNENAFTLGSLSTLNLLTLLAIILI